jgi:hypothetical protein
MKVHVELCWCGGERYSVRLTLRDGRNFRIPLKEGEQWNRRVSREARGLLEAETGLDRNRFRFDVR